MILRKVFQLFLCTLFSLYWAFFASNWFAVAFHHIDTVDMPTCENENACCWSEKDDCVRKCLTKTEISFVKKTPEQKEYIIPNTIWLVSYYNAPQSYKYQNSELYASKKGHTLFLEQYIGIQKIIW